MIRNALSLLLLLQILMVALTAPSAVHAGPLSKSEVRIPVNRTGTMRLVGEELKLNAYLNADLPLPSQPAPAGDEWVAYGSRFFLATGDVVRGPNDEFFLDTAKPGFKYVTFNFTQIWKLARNPSVTTETSRGISARYTVVKVHRFEMLTARNPDKLVAESCGLKQDQVDIVVEPADAELYFVCITSKPGPGTAYLEDSYSGKVEIPVTIAPRGSLMPELITPLSKEKIIKEKQTYYATQGDYYYRWVLTYTAVPEWKGRLQFNNYSSGASISSMEPVKWPLGPTPGYGEQKGKGAFAATRGFVALPGAWITAPTKIVVPPVPADGFFRDLKQYQLIYKAKSFSQYAIAPKSAAARPDLVAATDWKADGADATEYQEPLTTSTFQYHLWRKAP